MLNDDQQWKNRVAILLRQEVADGADEIAELLRWLVGEALSKERSESNDCGGIDDRLAVDLNHLDRGDFAKTSRVLLTSDFFLRIMGASKPPLGPTPAGSDGTDLLENPAFRFLHDYGVVTAAPGDRTIRLGYPTYRWRHWVPTTLTEALSNQTPVFWPPVYRQQYLDTIAGYRTSSAASHQPSDPSRLTPERMLAHARGLLRWYEEVVALIEHQSKEPFKKLMNPVDFYNKAAEMYAPLSPPSSRPLETHVFSTTSGLVIKEQYLGSDRLETSQYRRMYFDAIRATAGRVYYQLDPQTTWTSDKGLRRSLYPLEQHIDHFASFLAIPNLEVTEADFSKPETEWRRQHTLVASDKRVAYSTRDHSVKQISNGIIATRAYWEACGNRHPFDIVHRLYQSQLTSNQVIKRMDESLTAKEALSRSRSTFERWRKTYASA